jgi:lipopolysaccharide transport system ATP-binding protein
MSQPAIRVEGLGKKYRITHETRGRYKTLRETVMGAAAAPYRWMKGDRGTTAEEFWALKDVSFDVQPGEVVGIIGRNGAGKSTLLKVLSRITKPTKGRVELNGRVGSLLEVGTGFHPELTGRENVYLNGSILGMTRREIDKKFDEIVAFAEVEKFLDTPVKRYSSGMYVRLAFAVAAHLEPEILIVDEVLAVGDATFQQKCLDRMRELAKGGITVLFVTHNMDLVPRFCTSAKWFEDGTIKAVGTAQQVTADYLQDSRHMCGTLAELPRRYRRGSGIATFDDCKLIDSLGRETIRHSAGHDLTFRLGINSRATFKDVDIAVVLQTPMGARVITSWNREAQVHLSLATGRQYIDCTFHKLMIRPGHRVSYSLWLEAIDLLDWVEPAGSFEVVETPETRHFSSEPSQGIVLCEQSWKSKLAVSQS